MAAIGSHSITARSDATVRVEICIIGITDTASIRAAKRPYVSIRVPSLDKFCLDTQVSATAQWNHILRPFPIPSSAVVELELRERRWLGSKLLAKTQATVEDMLKMVGGNNAISLPMKPSKPTVIPPSLSLSIRVDKMDVAFVSAQLANVDATTSPNPYEPFQQVLRRLEHLTRLSSAVAQINPISNLVYSLAAGIAHIVQGHLALSEKLSALVHQIHAILEFVEAVEAVLTVEKFPALVQEILKCIMHCIVFMSKGNQSTPGRILISDDKSRIEKFQQELRDLNSRMTQSVTLQVAQETIVSEDERNAMSDDWLLLNLQPLPMPGGDRHFRSICFPGTRSKVISELTQWALFSPSEVLWIHAHAGSGKSTIANTMADLFSSLGCLGSFVFFDRDVKERSKPSHMIPTIAYQLAQHRTDIADEIRLCLKKHPRTLSLGQEIQFQRLLVEPLGNLDIKEPVVVIIDALDEGGDGPDQAAFLSLLSSGLSRLPNYMRVMITSRRYPNIQRAFERMVTLRILDLNQATDIDDDIRTYISAQLDGIPIPPGWSETTLVDSLVKQSCGLFIWATVACSYIKGFNSTARIQHLLSNPSVRARAEQSLDDLYRTAISEAGPWHDDDFAQYMRNVLAVIVVSQNPQSTQAISDILGVDKAVTGALISRLQSIIETDQNGRVRVIHPSVRDYLVDPCRCDPELLWFISEEVEDELMATRCIQYLNTRLTRHTGEQSTDGTLPDATAYACVSWAYHVCKVGPTAELADQIHAFLAQHFLHWVEVLSVLGQSRSAIGWLNEMQDWYMKFKISPTFDPSFNLMLYDMWRFLKAFSKTIEAGPSSVYDAALPFCPKNTAISLLFRHEKRVNIVSGCLQDWSPSLMTLTGFIMQIESLTVSRSGNTIAAGCIDGTLKVWDASLGTEIFSTPYEPDASTEDVVTTHLSSNGARLFFGVQTGVIRILEVKTGLTVTELNVRNWGHGRKPNLSCAALAADDFTVACGFQDGIVQIWDTKAQLELTPLLASHEGQVNSVAFSHNQQMIVTGAIDSTICLWSKTGIQERKLFGHTRSVTCVAFSPDDTRIGSSSKDGTMKVWDRLTGSVLVNCQHAPGEVVFAISFSHKGDIIATACQYSGIRIWNSESGQEIMAEFSLHRGPVVNLAFAPDDKTIISGSTDSHVRIWSLANIGRHISVQPTHTNFVSCVALAHDKSRWVSGSEDNLLIVWNTSDGRAAFPPFRAHHAGIVAVDFSGDDAMIASGSRDGIVHLWNASTGELRGEPLVHSHAIVCLKFSTNGSRLAVIAEDHRVTVWSIPAGEVLLGPGYYANCAYKAIAFSHDDAELAIFFYYGLGEKKHGLGIVIADSSDGHVLAESKIDDETTVEELYAVKFQYTADDRYLVLWYGRSITAKGVVAMRAFNVDTLEEHNVDSGSDSDEIPELNDFVAVDARVIKNGDKYAELPFDLDWMGDITCWDSTEGMVVIGIHSGDSYCITPCQ
ncbi:WD40-repeat-containing domain protein [Mycena maculata]|uniref:WD40-repeat-containing domain protein n=1 Tax=Mycena maculata TaxID=230809 RepID=A0AAD7JRK5_9AGAR|nr:WD40-repeat-containing domain protein [Mycena maculata]